MPSALNSPSLSRPAPAGQRRWPPAAPFLVAALVGALLLAVGPQIDWGSLSPFRSDGSEAWALPPCSTGRPQVTIAVLDVSSSVINRDGADPHGRSFDETRLLAKALNAAPCSQDDRFGAVIFANKAVEMPPTLVSSQSVIGRNLVRPPEDEIGGGTDIVRALDLAEQVASRHSESDVTVIVLSDMHGNSPGELDRRLATMTVAHIHLIALGSHDERLDPRFDSVTVLADVDKGTVAAALVDAVGSSRLAAVAADSANGMSGES